MGAGPEAGEGGRSAEFWVRQDCDAVRFVDEVRTLEGAGIGRDLQCGPLRAMSAEEDLRLLEAALGRPEAHLVLLKVNRAAPA
jgi:hypothetical protein